MPAFCHGAKPTKITVVGRRGTSKKFTRNEGVKFDNCNYLLETADQIIETAKPCDPPPGDNDGDASKVWVKDPAEFVELYRREKTGQHLSAEICVNTDGEVSFSIGTGDARIVKHPEAQQDFSNLIAQMQHAIEGMARVTSVISNFRFVTDGKIVDRPNADSELSRFNDYIIRQKTDITALKNDIRKPKAEAF
ncbi:MAG TPA: hypothetical protein VKR53_10065 [Puia sp.]|nr:hypothetical protein [Puia sp.]